MPFKVPIDGLVITADTAAEALELVKLNKKRSLAEQAVAVLSAANGAARAPRELELRGLPPVVADPDRQKRSVRAVKFVRRLLDSAPASSEEIATVFEARSPKALGTYLASVNKALEAHHIDPEDVYSNPRGADGARVWTAGPMAREALHALESEISLNS